MTRRSLPCDQCRRRKMRLRNTVTIRDTTFRLYRCRCGAEHLTRTLLQVDAQIPARIAG